ncbi:MAG: L,D-transpeptidase [Arenimonas sp.]|nr:L,D-transpeptidase [Arenimonas sp.]
MKNLMLAAALSLAVGQAHAQAVKAPTPAVKSAETLKPGEWIWYANAVPEGPMLLMVSIAQQKAYLYRNGIRVGVTTVSTGKKGHETPTGVFTILQKNKDHKSNLYNSAPMPYMQRLTWDGIALHTGKLPGYPASHGCVRMPDDFAKRLFAETDLGMTVVVTDDVADTPSNMVDPKILVQPMDAKGQPIKAPSLSAGEEYRWQPEKSPFGPLTVLISISDRSVTVLRNGVEIGRARISVAGDEPFGNQAYVVLEGVGTTPSLLLPDRPSLKWMNVSVPNVDPSGTAAKKSFMDEDAISRIAVPVEFSKLVYEALKPGSSLLLTDQSITKVNSGQGMTVLTDSSVDDR